MEHSVPCSIQMDQQRNVTIPQRPSLLIENIRRHSFARRHPLRQVESFPTNNIRISGARLAENKIHSIDSQLNEYKTNLRSFPSMLSSSLYRNESVKTVNTVKSSKIGKNKIEPIYEIDIEQPRKSIGKSPIIIDINQLDDNGNQKKPTVLSDRKINKRKNCYGCQRSTLCAFLTPIIVLLLVVVIVASVIASIKSQSETTLQKTSSTIITPSMTTMVFTNTLSISKTT